MAPTNRYLLVFDSKSCLTDFRHQLNLQNVIRDFKASIPVKPPKKVRILVSDSEGIKMAQIVRMAMEDLFPKPLALPEKPERAKMSFNFVNEIENEMKHTRFIILVCHEREKVLTGLNLKAPSHLEPEQFLLYKLGVNKVLHLSPVLIKD